MAKLNQLKTGEVLSEAQFYVVEKIKGGSVQLKPDAGASITVDGKYVEDFLTSGEQFSSEQKINRTELAATFLANPNIAMTANFNKQVKSADVEKEIVSAYENSTPASFAAAVKKAVKKGLGGEERTIVGRHNGVQDEFGRVQFVDMKLPADPNKSFDPRYRQVDPRTLNWLILKGVKYSVK